MLSTFSDKPGYAVGPNVVERHLHYQVEDNAVPRFEQLVGLHHTTEIIQLEQSCLHTLAAAEQTPFYIELCEQIGQCLIRHQHRLDLQTPGFWLNNSHTGQVWQFIQHYTNRARKDFQVTPGYFGKLSVFIS